MPTEYDFLQVRPPWPDELPRLGAFFPQEPLHSCHLFVLAAPEPERLAGVAAVRLHAETAELRCRLRPRVLHERRGEPLLNAALAAARAQGLRRVVARPSPDTPEHHFLREHGFEGTETTEHWQVSLERINARLARIPETKETQGTWTVRAPIAADEVHLAGLFSHVDPERLRLRDPEDSRPGIFAPEISSVVTVDGGLIGALLLRSSQSGNCHVGLCKVTHGHWPAPIAIAMLRRSVREALKEGFLSASLRTKDAPEARAVRNLARRSGGTIERRSLLLVRQL